MLYAVNGAGWFGIRRRNLAWMIHLHCNVAPREKQGQSPIFTNEVRASASGLEAALYSYADDGIVALGVI